MMKKTDYPRGSREPEHEDHPFSFHYGALIH